MRQHWSPPAKPSDGAFGSLTNLTPVNVVFESLNVTQRVDLPDEAVPAVVRKPRGVPQTIGRGNPSVQFVVFVQSGKDFLPRSTCVGVGHLLVRVAPHEIAIGIVGEPREIP